MTVSAKWVAQTLRDRGVHLDAQRIQVHLEGLDEAAMREVAVLMNSVANGVEDHEELQRFVSRVRGQVGPANESARPSPKVETRQSQGQQPAPVRAAKKAHQSTRATAPAQDRQRSVVRQALRGYGRTWYGSSAAMRAEIDLLAGEEGEPLRHTLQLEFARANPDRSFNWKNKAAFQFTLDELALLGGFLLAPGGAGLTLNNHGPARNKTLELKWQGGGLYVKFRQGAAMASLPLEPQHVHALRVLLLQASKLNAPEIEAGAQIALLRLVALAREGQGEPA